MNRMMSTRRPKRASTWFLEYSISFRLMTSMSQVTTRARPATGQSIQKHSTTFTTSWSQFAITRTSHRLSIQWNVCKFVFSKVGSLALIYLLPKQSCSGISTKYVQSLCVQKSLKISLKAHDRIDSYERSMYDELFYFPSLCACEVMKIKFSRK